MISYELILSSAVLIIILLTGSFNFTTIIEQQQSIWFIIPLLPIFIFYFISILAETARTPFDLQEAKTNFLSPSVFFLKRGGCRRQGSTSYAPSFAIPGVKDSASIKIAIC